MSETTDGPIQSRTFHSVSEYLEYVEEQCLEMLGLTYHESMALLATGALDGTLAETRLKLFSSMLSAGRA